MSTSIASVRGEYGTVIWPADPRYLVCPDGHLFRMILTGMRRDGRGLLGHDFFRCEQCAPPSHWFSVFARTPDPLVLNFLISEDCWRAWMDRSGDTPSTQEMLAIVTDPMGRNYYPHFRGISTHGREPKAE